MMHTKEFNIMTIDNLFMSFMHVNNVKIHWEIYFETDQSKQSN